MRANTLRWMLVAFVVVVMLTTLIGRAEAGSVCGPRAHAWRGHGTPTVIHIVAPHDGYSTPIWCVPNRA